MLRNRAPWLAVSRSTFSRYGPLFRTAHISITILSRFCSQIKLKTSYNWEQLVGVFEMNANFYVQSVTSVWKLFYFLISISILSLHASFANPTIKAIVRALSQKLTRKYFSGEKICHLSALVGPYREKLFPRSWMHRPRPYSRTFGRYFYVLSEWSNQSAPQSRYIAGLNMVIKQVIEYFLNCKLSSS